MISLMTSSVDFTNVLRKAFMRADPKSPKNTVFFALLGSAPVKAACKMLMKLTSDQRKSISTCSINTHDITSRLSTTKELKNCSYNKLFFLHWNH